MISAKITWPFSPTIRENFAVKSPVPPPKSRMRCPGRAPEQSMVKRFHKRWIPPDIRSFMMSYLAATE
ncbi:Uncharacterised protein [Vibrio cholerae]|nr:Uncharacterised protein [Vibrio cholerae]CSD21218.1 Uncharacterised protein [Vibrio cholerae]CSI87511.1 Uncharacterised protein [Vibrio cholerae]